MGPRVRVVIVSYNGRDLTLRSVESVKASDWPREQLEIVVVDNASTDGSAEALEREHPDVLLLRSARNLGFAGANNLALQDLEDTDYVALVNNDAIVGREWLSPLVNELESDSKLGATAPKILFEPTFAEIGIESPESQPRRGDWRKLGICLSGIRIGGRDGWTAAQFPSGWHELEHKRHPASPFRWSTGEALLRIPWPHAGAQSLQLQLQADRKKTIKVSSGPEPGLVEVDRKPKWIDVPVVGDPVDVINNAGSLILSGGFGADRGILERDDGQFDQPADVFAWCGCCVVLRRSYLKDVGLLEPRFFLYYEDLDLSWRGQARGWRYRYLPASTVRHHHTSATVEGSPLFQHYVERNRLLVHARNAPSGCAFRVFGRFVWEAVRETRRDVLVPVLQLRRPRFVFVRRRLWSLAAFLWLLPPTLRARRSVRRRQCVSDDDLLQWLDRR
jgi:GT2 family glycosyltransferase